MLFIIVFSFLGIFLNSMLVLEGLKKDNFKTACLGMALIVIVVLLTIISFQLTNIMEALSI